jgi:hypothetical protein
MSNNRKINKQAPKELFQMGIVTMQCPALFDHDEVLRGVQGKRWDPADMEACNIEIGDLLVAYDTRPEQCDELGRSKATVAGGATTGVFRTLNEALMSQRFVLRGFSMSATNRGELTTHNVTVAVRGRTQFKYRSDRPKLYGDLMVLYIPTQQEIQQNPNKDIDGKRVYPWLRPVRMPNETGSGDEPRASSATVLHGLLLQTIADVQQLAQDEGIDSLDEYIREYLRKKTVARLRRSTPELLDELGASGVKQDWNRDSIDKLLGFWWTLLLNCDAEVMVNTALRVALETVIVINQALVEDVLSKDASAYYELHAYLLAAWAKAVVWFTDRRYYLLRSDVVAVALRDSQPYEWSDCSFSTK